MDEEKLCVQILILNIDFNSVSFDSLGSRSSA